MNNDESRDEELLRRALRAEADKVLPSPDALARIRRRTARPPLWRTPLALGLAGAMVTASAVVAGSVVMLGGSNQDETVTGPSDNTAATSDPSPDPSTSGPTEAPQPTSPAPEVTSPPAAMDNANVPVYYVAEQADGSLRLVREFRDVPAPDGPVVAAVKTMLTEPARDPDYRSLWDASTEVESVEIHDGVIEVDLTGFTDYAGAGDEEAQLATQQLVYTVTAALASIGEDGGLPVRLLVNGVPAAQVWGSLDLSGPVDRVAQIDVRQLVQINNPAEGATVGRTVTVDGEAAVFEANVLWQILGEDGEEVQSSYTTTTSAGTFTPFTFSVELEPGAYTVIVSESDPSNGEGRPPMSDTRNFTVE